MKYLGIVQERFKGHATLLRSDIVVSVMQQAGVCERTALRAFHKMIESKVIEPANKFGVLQFYRLSKRRLSSRK